MLFLIIFIILIVITVVLFIVGFKMFNISCRVSNKEIFKLYEKNRMGFDDRCVNVNIDWLNEQDIKDVYIKSSDGLKLHGVYLAAPNAYRTVICVHGYRGSYATDFSAIFRYLYNNHSNVLLIEQRGHGDSQGDFITFGAMESDDVSKWLDFTSTKLDDKHPIYLYGVSMGATSVLLSLSHHKPYMLKGVIADCGYSSMKTECKYLCKNWFHIPAFPLVNIVNFYCNLIARFHMKDTSTKKALTNNEIPILFIHGESDTFVEPENSRTNYARTKGPKELVWIKGANHAESIFKNPELYHAKLEYFFNTYK